MYSSAIILSIAVALAVPTFSAPIIDSREPFRIVLPSAVPTSASDVVNDLESFVGGLRARKPFTIVLPSAVPTSAGDVVNDLENFVGGLRAREPFSLGTIVEGGEKIFGDIPAAPSATQQPTLPCVGLCA